METLHKKYPHLREESEKQAAVTAFLNCKAANTPKDDPSYERNNKEALLSRLKNYALVLELNKAQLAQNVHHLYPLKKEVL